MPPYKALYGPRPRFTPYRLRRGYVSPKLIKLRRARTARMARGAMRLARYSRYARFGGYAALGGLAAYATYKGVKKLRRIRNAKSTGKTNEYYVAGTSLTMENLQRKTLFTEVIQPCLPPGDNNDIRRAPAMNYWLKGLKMCATFRNPGDEPLSIHMAIIQPKEDKITVGEIPTDMFVDNAQSSQRFSDFVNIATSATWNRTQDCAALNKNKFNIIAHQKFVLNAGSATPVAGATSEHGSAYKHMERYFKVNKRFAYDSISDSNVTHPLYVLVWYETMFPVTGTLANPLEFNVRTVGYVRDK